MRNVPIGAKYLHESTDKEIYARTQRKGFKTPDLNRKERILNQHLFADDKELMSGPVETAAVLSKKVRKGVRQKEVQGI